MSNVVVPVDNLVSKLRQVREHRDAKRKGKSSSRFRYQACLRTAVHDVYRNGLLPIFNPYFSTQDEEMQTELWDIKHLVCGGDVQQAKLYITKQVEPLYNEDAPILY